jgi:hypothetical protein
MRAVRILAIALAIAAFGPVSARAIGEWTDQTLEANPEFGLTDSAIRVDAAGRPHVFVGGDRVYHYWLEGGEWQSEIVDAHARSGAGLRVAVGPSGEFHLVYLRTERTGDMNPRSQLSPYDPPATETFLEYATNLSGTWIVEQIGNAPTLRVSGLAVDASHSPHVLVDGSGASPSHGVRSAGQWTFETIDASGLFPGSSLPDSYFGSALAFDAAGNLHAIWFPPGDLYAGGLIYAKRDGSGWHLQSVPSANGKAVVPVRLLAVLVLDGDANPHVLAHSGDGFIQDTYLTLSGWWMDVFGDPLYRPSTFTAAADSTGRVHVLTLTSSGGNGFMQVNHWVKSGSTWNSEVALGSIPAPYFRYLALTGDSSGGLHAAYLGNDTDGHAPLGYLHRDSAWSSTEIARGYSGELASAGADVRIGLVGHSRRLLYRLGPIISRGEPVRHRIERGAGEFDVEIVPATCGPEPSTLAFAVDSTARERAMWVCSGPVESIRADDGGWTTFSPSDEFGYWAMRPGITFDGGGALHAAFLAEVNNFFTAVHTVDTNQRLLEEVISPEIGDWGTGERPGTLAIAAGPLGSMAVAGLSGKDVWAGTNATGQWVGSVVGVTPGDLPFGSYALAVTGDGIVHIAYENRDREPGSHPTLMYGTNECIGGFYVTEVDPLTRLLGPGPNDFTVGSRNPDIALDPVGNPHISYRREADHSLAYAHVHDSAWTTETVVSDTSTGEESAIAVDDSGVVSIAHHDDWAGDLRLATRAPLAAEPHWDGCPPLPDPNALRGGSFIFEPPAGTVPVYDPTDPEVTAQYETAQLKLDVFAQPGGKVFVDGLGDMNGDGLFNEAGVQGRGAVTGKRGQVVVREAILVRTETDSRLKIVRQESIDTATLLRSIRERAVGKLNGQKLELDQSSTDQLPVGALFPFRLELQIASGKTNGLVASAVWRRRGYQDPIELKGSGKWSPVTETADVTLKGQGVSLKLAGLHIWKSYADGIHLSAKHVSGSAFGQKIDADLSGAF